MAAYSSAGRVPLVIWAATVDPADVPMMRSASVTSTPASDRPAMRPSSHALSAAPAPARTKARLPELPACLVASGRWSGIGQFPCRGVPVTALPSELVVEQVCGVEEGESRSRDWSHILNLQMLGAQPQGVGDDADR